jgi:3-methyladenine DNA glycosylase AlkD
MKTEQWSLDWVHKARACMEANENSANAAAMKSYLKDNFLFYGIPKPQRALLTKDLFAKHGVPNENQFRGVVQLLWDETYRELHYLALEVLIKNKKHFIESDIHLFEEMMRTHSWWDSIDFISPTLVGIWLKKFPKKKSNLLYRWNQDGNFWIRRASLLAQLKEKGETDHKLLFRLIIPLTNEKEFFIRKAIGWSLRELAKYKPNEVLSFVEHCDLSPLSRREALKHLSS